MIHLRLTLFLLPLFAAACQTPSTPTLWPIPLDEAAKTALAPGQPRIKLFWRTESEENAFGYYVYRTATPTGPAQCLNRQYPIPAAGTTAMPQEYTFYDLNVTEGGDYFYKLEQVDLDGAKTWLVGHPEAVRGQTKPLTEEEAAAIRQQGVRQRQEAL